MIHKTFVILVTFTCILLIYFIKKYLRNLVIAVVLPLVNLLGLITLSTRLGM